MLEIRKANDDDFDAIWPIFHEIVSQGETYPFSPNTTRDEAYNAWMLGPAATYVAVHDGEIVGTYALKPNQPGLGAHVCNCGYVVSGSARGRGVASTMCEHSQIEAASRGYRAMQFNLVAASNEGAVRLWKKLGFEIAGTLPEAFAHPTQGFVDAHVMYKFLISSEDR